MIRPLVLACTMAARAAEPGVDPAELPRFVPLSPDEALQSFDIRHGFRIELAACEPQVMDPVAMAFDDGGRLYVVEMRDYSERRAEKLSCIRRLEDRDHDGRFEHSTVFMDGLAWATAVICHEDGVFAAASPDIWWARDTSGDGVADEKRVVFTGFGEGVPKLNVQALLNSLTWGPDGRVYGATAANGGVVRKVSDGRPQGEALNLNGADFSFDPDHLDLRAESGTAQFGLTFDERGNRYVCSNSAHIRWVGYERKHMAPGRAFPLPPPLVDIAEDGAAAPVFRISPEEPWRVMRTRWRASGLVPGIVEGGGRASGYFTSASGIHISLGAVCRGDAFIGDVGSNLVHRKRLHFENGMPSARRAEDEIDREFLACRDTWFRPVAFASGPDGGLYIADMYREFIEHPDSLPPPLKKHLDLNSGNDRGRIWRVVPERFERTAKKYAVRIPQQITGGAGEGHPILSSGTGDDFFRTTVKLFRRPALPAYVRHLVLARLRPEDVRPFFHAARPADPQAAMVLADELGIAPPEEMLGTAREWLRAGTDAQRLAAVECVAGAGDASLAAVVLDPGQPPEVRVAAFVHHPAVAPALLDSWSAQPAALRGAVMDFLVNRDAVALLAALTARTIDAAEVSPLHASALRAHKTRQVREQAARLLPAPADRRAEIEKRQAALKLKGDPDRGRAHFLARCATCHRDGADGFAAGPDRVTMRNKGAPLLLVAVLDPNREVAPQYFTTIVTAQDGQTLAGVLTREDTQAVTVVVPGAGERTVLRSQIKSIERQSKSLMPEGVEAGLTDQEMADLLAFAAR